MLMIRRDSAAAIQYAQDLVSNLLQDKTPLEKLVISKAYSKTADEYASKQAHVELVRRMQVRDPATAPQIGDRVPYVIVGGRKGAKAFEKVEDPGWVRRHNIPIDTSYYIDNQLKKPLLRIFGPILASDRPAESEEESLKRAEKLLFHGPHTRRIVRKTPMTMGIGRFCVSDDFSPS